MRKIISFAIAVMLTFCLVGCSGSAKTLLIADFESADYTYKQLQFGADVSTVEKQEGKLKKLDIGETKDKREIYQLESTMMYEGNSGTAKYEFNSENHGEGLNMVSFEFQIEDDPEALYADTASKLSEIHGEPSDIMDKEAGPPNLKGSES